MQIQISDDLYPAMRQAAEANGLSDTEFLEQAITAFIDHSVHEVPLSEQQIARMKEGIAQLDRGEYVSFEQVEAFFDDWEKELQARSR